MDDNLMYLQSVVQGGEPSWDDGWEGWVDDRHDGGRDRWDDGYDSPDELGEVAFIAVIDGHVVGSYRRPVRGSGYECAARELGRPRPAPAPRVVEVDREPRWSRELGWLARLVGGAEALDALTTEPLAPEPLDLTAVQTAVRERVEAVDRVVEEACAVLDEPELGIACRRLLLRAARGGAATRQLLGGADSLPRPAAAALLYGVARANALTGTGCAVTQRLLAETVGATVSSDRATRWVLAVGGAAALHGTDRDGFYGARHRNPEVPVLGSPDLLTSGFRRHLVTLRDLARSERDRLAAS